MNNIIVIETNSSYLQFIITLNKCIQKFRSGVKNNEKIDFLVADVLGPLYQAKSLIKDTAEYLETLTNDMFEQVESGEVDSMAYSLTMEAKVFQANDDVEELFKLAKKTIHGFT